MRNLVIEDRWKLGYHLGEQLFNIVGMGKLVGEEVNEYERDRDLNCFTGIFYGIGSLDFEDLYEGFYCNGMMYTDDDELIKNLFKEAVENVKQREKYVMNEYYGIEIL